MNTQQLAIRRLYWKEGRQLFPLAALLIAIGILVLVWQRFDWFGLGGGAGHAAVSFTDVCFHLPLLFAIGASALQISQEKEQRTLQWLGWLPIPHGDLVRVKFTVGLFGFLLVWLATIVIVHLGRADEYGDMQMWLPGSFIRRVVMYGIVSSFVYVCGSMVAWRLKPSLLNYFWLIPLAVIPILLAGTLDYVSDVRRPRAGFMRHDPSPLSVFLVHLPLFGLFAWYAYRAGLEYLRCPAGPSRRFWNRHGETSLVNDYLVDDASSDRPRLAPISMLVWQWGRQNLALIVGCAVTLLVGGQLVLTMYSPNDLIAWLAILSTLCAISWLSVAAFQNDRVDQRIRFLAERGVSPWQAWYTRLLIPTATIMCLSLLIAAKITHGQIAVDLNPTLMLLCVPTTFGISQWSAQCLSGRLLASVVAPLLSAIAVYYVAVAHYVIGTSPPWLIVAMVVPFVATRHGTRSWMDGTFLAAAWRNHLVYLCLYLGLPWIPLALCTVGTPRMPPSVAQAIEATCLVAPGKPQNVPWTVQIDQKLVRQSNTEVIAQLKKSIGFRTFGDIPPNVVEYLHTAMIMSRSELAMQSTAESETLARYHTTFKLLSRTVHVLRQSYSLADQERADRIEIELLKELRQSRAREWIGADLFKETLLQIGNAELRNQARRRAVARSWLGYVAQLRARESDVNFGGFPLRNTPHYLPQTLIEQRRATRELESAVTTMWLLTNRTPEEVTIDDFQPIAAAWHVPMEMYGAGELGRRLRADDLDQYVPSDHWTIYVFGQAVPAMQWHADWERQARELAAQVAESDP